MYLVLTAARREWPMAAFLFWGGGGWWDMDSSYPKVPVLPPFSWFSLVWSTLKDLKAHDEIQSLVSCTQEAVPALL